MLIRIWWKEMRSLAPIMATLALTLMVLQWFLLAYGGADMRRGVLVPIALGWAALYALVAGAASFAGEREVRMMGFLDALPVGRGMLWLGKASFAVGSSLLVGVAFRLISLLGWDWVSVNPLLTFPRVDLFFALLLVEAAIWGLVWSSLSKNAITAGILAIITTTATVSLGSILGWNAADQQFGKLDSGTVEIRLGLIAAGLVVSYLVLDRELNGWLPPRHQRATDVTPRLAAVPVEARWTGWSIWPSPGFWSVSWQTVREGRSTWWLSLAIVSILPGFVALIAQPSFSGGGLLIVLIYLALLIQGTSVFGLENSGGTRQFLDNQAVRPRMVWAAKVTTWGFGLVIFFAIFALVSVLILMFGQTGGMSDGGIRDSTGLIVALAIAADTFAVGMVGGMIFTRRITAVMVSFLALLVITVPQMALFTADMIPAWSLGLTPLILLGISFLWAGDWLAVRGDLRRWSRLTVLGIVPTVGLCLWYVGGRAWGIPDIGPDNLETNNPAVWNSSTHDAYVQLERQLVRPELGPESNPVDLVVAADLVRRGWSTASPEVVATWKANTALIDQARRLAARPEAVPCYDMPVGLSMSLLDEGEDTGLFPRMKLGATLLTWDGLERRSRGDFVGAWEDILAQYRMSVQAAGGARSIRDYYAAMRIAEGALQQALAWAREPNVPLDAVHAARLAIQELRLPDMTDVIRAESQRLEAALDLPTERWVDELTPTSRNRGAADNDDTSAAFQRIINSWAIVPSWERERTRRILRSVTRIALDYARNDHYERDGYLPFYPQNGRVRLSQSMPDPTLPKVSGVANRDVDYAVTPMADRVLGWIVNSEREYDRELTNRRGLDTILAIRSWQITHDGDAPVDLAQLVPGTMNAIPVDPFLSNRELLSYLRGTAEEGNSIEGSAVCWLSSVGPDGRRGGLQGSQSNPNPWPGDQRGDDLIYALPAHIPPTKPVP